MGSEEPPDMLPIAGAGSDFGDDPADDVGGDPACWLSLLCPECGAVLESHTDPCWRCGLRPGEDPRG